MELLHAAEVGNARGLRVMLQSGADVDFCDPRENKTALHILSAHGRLPEIRLMIEAYNASPNIRDEHYHLPVHTAAAAGQTHVVAYFVGSGIACLNSWSDHWGLLHIASFQGHAPTVKWLLDHGADPLARGMHGRLPIHRAAYTDSKGALESVRLMLDWGIDVNSPDDSGWTALHSAAQQGNVAVASLLLERGASLQEFDLCCGGETPLMLCVANGHLEMTKLLLGTLHDEADYAAVLGTVNSQDQTVIHKAVEQGHLGVLEALLACPCVDAALGWRDKAGRTAADLARDVHDIPMALTLSREPWTTSRHSDYPYEFKVAVQCVLCMALVDDQNGKKVPHHPTKSGGEHGFWSLPSGVLHQIFACMAFPLSSWKRCETASENILSDSPADIIAANMRAGGGCDHPAVDTRDLQRRAAARSGPLRDPLRSDIQHVEGQDCRATSTRAFDDTASPADIIWDNTVLAHHRRSS